MVSKKYFNLIILFNNVKLLYIDIILRLCYFILHTIYLSTTVNFDNRGNPRTKMSLNYDEDTKKKKFYRTFLTCFCDSDPVLVLSCLVNFGVFRNLF